jgi:hypothetical protein
MSEFSWDKENQDFKTVCGKLCEIHSIKSMTYGDSWKKHGEQISVFGNLSRKYDRIERIITEPELWAKAMCGELNEDLEETILDLAVYSILWCSFIMSTRPEKFEAAYQKAVGVKQGG